MGHGRAGSRLAFLHRPSATAAAAALPVDRSRARPVPTPFVCRTLLSPPPALSSGYPAPVSEKEKKTRSRGECVPAIQPAGAITRESHAAQRHLPPAAPPLPMLAKRQPLLRRSCFRKLLTVLVHEPGGFSPGYCAWLRSSFREHMQIC